LSIGSPGMLAAKLGPLGGWEGPGRKLLHDGLLREID
jgi:hypothetical protein